MRMRAGGKEIEHVETHTPGQVEFPPAKPGDKRRVVEGERLYIDYAANNAIESFRAIQARTRAEGIGKDRKPLVTRTSSQDLQAWFEPRNGQMTRLEQWNQFEYEEGARRARAERAQLDQTTGLITLKRSARLWDDTGSTTGDEIVLEQDTGDMAVSGNVTSTRLPDRKPNAKKSDTLVSNREPMQAKAARMITLDGARKIRYEGGAVLWQGASRVVGDTVLIDQDAERLEATGNVVTTLPDRRDEKGRGGSATTVVKARKFVYDGKAKLGDYTGGSEMTRPTLFVKSQRLRAWFVEVPRKDGGAETQLDRMFADGSVEFVERGKDRTRTGAAEHAEHYPREEKTILTGGAPFVNDSLRGVTRGDVITWVAREDRLIVDNTGSGPAVSRIQRERRD
jgi:lipopolysaccharide export system protein LptA